MQEDLRNKFTKAVVDKVTHSHMTSDRKPRSWNPNIQLINRNRSRQLVGFLVLIVSNCIEVPRPLWRRASWLAQNSSLMLMLRAQKPAEQGGRITVLYFLHQHDGKKIKIKIG